ncbi:MAG: LysM peptidoglycan-binding domain-containing protein, partial [Planctomycetes bacterium]|nr:LysM peptidoglycan-binding domain-containing protein [Planctomycetota bacterium]
LDPFAEEVVKMAGNESIDELEAELEKPRHNARPPAAGNSRHASHTPATAHKPQRKSAPVDEILDLDADEDSLANALAQSEPELDDADFPEQEEELPVSRKKKPTLASRDESRASTSHRNSRSHSAGPRLDYDPDMPSDLPDELPEEDDLTSSRMDDYEPTQPRSSSHRRTTNHQNAYHQNPGQRRGPQITHVGVDDEDTDAADPRLDGFSVDDVSSRRAYSSTRIVRSGAEDLGDGNTAPGNLPSGAGDSGDATPLHRRGAGSADTSSHTRRHTSGEFSESAGSSGPATTEIYRIQPDDNFWKISRKHYGTARYYQALMRHNQDRVADPQRLRPGTQISIPPAAYLERHYAGLIEKPAGGTASRQTASRGAASPASDGRPRFDNGSRDRRGDDTGEAAPSNASSEGYFYSKSGEPMYRVGPEDTLGSIAQKHLGRASRWTEIYEQNQDKLESPDNLKLGTVIRLPTDASRLSLVPENGRRR